MFFDPDLSIWENIYKSTQFSYLLCMFLFIVLLIGLLTAKTKERKTEIGNLISAAAFVSFIVIISSSFMIPIARANMTASSKDEINEITAHSQYESPTSKTDCYLCGIQLDELISLYYGENNIAVLDINTFDIHRLEINRYDDDKNLIEKKAGYMQSGGTSFQDGSSMFFYIDSDRGCADGSITLSENSILSLDSVSAFLCSECLTDFMNSYNYDEERWNIALLNLENKTIKPLQESVAGFGMGDFSIKSRYDETDKKIELLIWYSPVRYE